MEQKKSAPESQSEQLHNGDKNPSRPRKCLVTELKISISGKLENGATFSTDGTINNVSAWEARDFIYDFRYCVPEVKIEDQNS